MRAPAAVSYLRTLAAAQRTLATRLAVSIPAARVGWHYGVALDGVSVVLPASDLARLRALPGATVWPTVTYHAPREVPASSAAATADPGPSLIGATALWGQNLATAGQGLKIGIIDDGIDQAHPYFSPSGFSYPAGFPKGNTAYTTPKVIVARAFPSPSMHWKYADKPFDPVYSDHATHVAGIAAGDYDTPTAPKNGSPISGVAPKAYLGNYKVYTVPTADYGLDGNSPEIAKGIDQAVADGMNVINLSIGEPEVEPRRDIVVQALDNAAAAGVVPVVAAGNDYDVGGLGTIGSPGNAPAAITVAASTMGNDDGTRPDHIADFSSAGPTPVSLQLKPDVTAPGVDVLSSVPPHDFEPLDGTSMAAPHVAGGAALLLQRHPTWTVQQVKSALASTGSEVHPAGRSGEVSVLREGGGRIDLVRANQPLIFTDPTSLGWGLVRRGFSGTKQLSTADAGGGSAPWSVSIHAQSMPRGGEARAAGEDARGRSVTRPAAHGLADGTRRQRHRLRRADPRHRRPAGRVLVPRRGAATRARSAPDSASAGPLPRRHGRKGVARLLLSLSPTRPRLGSADAARRAGAGVPVHPAAAGRELRRRGRRPRTGGPGLAASRRRRRREPRRRLHRLAGGAEPVSGLRPGGAGRRSRAARPGHVRVRVRHADGREAGERSRFRFWVDDTSPPSIRLLATQGHDRAADPRRRPRLRLRRRPAVAPREDRQEDACASRTPTACSGCGRAAFARAGRPSIVRASDYQETKNMEDVGPVLPNTRVLHTTVTLRR